MDSANFQPDEAFARQVDAADPLRRFRDQFHIPETPSGQPVAYFCGHSLGLQPKSARALVEQELDDWANLGVEGHFRGRTPWYGYHELLRESGARLVGARPGEVVFMNSLTVNLHLMLATFYRPTKDRFKILTDEPAFPSDRYALQSQLRHHGFDPAEGLLTIGPGAGESTIRSEDIEGLLDDRGREIAVACLNGVNFVTGQWYDIPRITSAAHRHGCVAGFDLAHAAGNVPLALHDWNVDFAVWCSYKYLNGGPGTVGGCFVHEKHGSNLDLPRLAGWWGNDPATRFQMPATFIPRPGADGWQISNPPILSLAPLRAALALFDQATMPALRAAKSERMTGYLLFLLDRLPPGRFELLTPRDPARRGCQVSIRVRNGGPELLANLEREGVLADFRAPDVIRVAPVPLYNQFEEVWRFAAALGNLREGPR